jgi:hypothetical protein
MTVAQFLTELAERLEETRLLKQEQIPLALLCRDYATIARAGREDLETPEGRISPCDPDQTEPQGPPA